MIDIPVFDQSTNETDVREALITPLISALGYGGEEIIRERRLNLGSGTEVRADYVLETGYDNEFGLPTNRIVIEVKKPIIPLSEEVLDQAVSYSSHRLIEAAYVVLVNGVEMSIYETAGNSPVKVIDLKIEDINQKWHLIEREIGAVVMRRYFAGTEILEEIGSGGFGHVFKVKHKKLGRIEAIKILNPSIEPRSNIIRRFNQGAKGLALSKHPYICEVYDVGVYRGRPFYRMDYIPGVSVTKYVNNHQLPLEDRLSLFGRICEAISHAHMQGIFHCDLKPANILVTDEGIPKVIDFDFCHIGDKTSTVVSQIGATIAYMDRTIWRSPQNRDQLADVFSIGLVLWSILTGEELRPDWTAEDLMSGLMDKVGNWGTESLGQVVLRCVSIDRKNRPKSIGDVRRLLEIKDWHSSIHSLIDGVVGPIAVKSPERAFEFRFRLWKQGGGLPGSNDFEFIKKGLPERPLTSDQREFLFRSACAHWRKAHRTVFSKWTTDDIIEAAQIVVNDVTLDTAHTDTIAETHPARKAMDILAVTDEYRSSKESEKVAKFLLNQLTQGRLKVLFHTILDDLARLQCFKQKNSRWRKEVSIVLMNLIEQRLPKANKDSRRQIGKLLEKLSPGKCGDDSEEVAAFIRDIARVPALFENAIKTLGCLKNAHASDAFIVILGELKESDPEKFELAATWAVGVKGKHPRQFVIDYLKEIESTSSPEIKAVIQRVYKKFAGRYHKAGSELQQVVDQ